MAVTLTGYGGVGEIGGNAFLLDDGKSRLFLDLGKRFGNDPRLDERRGIDTRHQPPGWNDYFDDFLSPRGFAMAADLARLGIIPDIPTLWRQDRGGSPGPRPVDGVLVSHAHMDHCGLLGLLRPDVPIFASADSAATLRSLQTTGSGVMSEYLSMRPKGILPNKDGKPGKGTHWKDENGIVETPRRLVDGDVEVGAWRLRHHLVDHSIHGARATILEGPASVAYTGDFRMHGRDADATKRFIGRAGGVDVLVAEGTRVSRTHDHGHDQTDDEAAVEGQIQAILDATGDRFVGISFPPRDLDRFISVWTVARRSGRRLVIPTKLAHLIDCLRDAGREDLPDPKRDAHIAIHVPARGRGVIQMPAGVLRMPERDGSLRDVAVDDKTWSDFWRSDHEKWELPYLAGQTVTSVDVAMEPHAYLFSISYWTINELFDLFPGTPDDGLNGAYIHSMTQPFNDEMEIGDRKLERWLHAFRLERHDTHVSGHLSEKDLEWVLDEVGARVLVPVHSQAPDLTADRYAQRTGQRAMIPTPGKELHLA